MAKPIFFPRAQMSGLFRCSCVYCGKVGEFTVRPTAFRTRCTACKRLTVWGHVAHIPGGVKYPMDGTIPTWADDEFTFDPIPFDPMPRAIFDPDRPLRQRGRANYIIIHDNVWATDDIVPVSPAEAEEYIRNR